MNTKYQSLQKKQRDFFGSSPSIISPNKTNYNNYYYNYSNRDMRDKPKPTYAELLIRMLENSNPKKTLSSSIDKNKNQNKDKSNNKDKNKTTYNTISNSTSKKIKFSNYIGYATGYKSRNRNSPSNNNSKKNFSEIIGNSSDGKNLKFVNVFKSNKIQKARGKLKKIYKYENFFLKNKEKVINSKNLDLKVYQDNLLKLSSNTFGKDNMIKLYTELKNLRSNTENIKPLPPVNIRTLIKYSIEKNEIIQNGNKDRKSKNKLTKGKIINKLDRWGPDKDVEEYEKELLMIKKLNNKSYSYVNPVYQQYELKRFSFMPEYLIESLKNKKK